MEFSVQKNVHLKCSPLFPSRVHFDFQIRNEFRISFQWTSLLGLCPICKLIIWATIPLCDVAKIFNRKNPLFQYNDEITVYKCLCIIIVFLFNSSALLFPSTQKAWLLRYGRLREWREKQRREPTARVALPEKKELSVLLDFLPLIWAHSLNVLKGSKAWQSCSYS